MFNILIAEDDYDVCQLFKHVLLKKGYSVTTVSNGKEALDAIEKEQFDLLISDIMMPVMDGYELVRQMREVNEEIPVLMITAKDAFDDMQKGFLSGTDDYMVKPVNVDESSKCFEQYKSLLTIMLENNFSRGDCVVAVGGGVVGDLSGFTASSYMQIIESLT